MSNKPSRNCTTCGAPVTTENLNYRYTESGLPNVILQGVAVATCPNCGEAEVSIPHIAKLHRAIARALANSPARLTGSELRFLRKYLALSGEEFGRYLHTDKTKISKWETGQDPIGPATDRLIRLLVIALDKHLSSQVASVAEHLPHISDEPGAAWELHVNAPTLQATFIRVSRAA